MGTIWEHLHDIEDIVSELETDHQTEPDEFVKLGDITIAVHNARVVFERTKLSNRDATKYQT